VVERWCRGVQRCRGALTEVLRCRGDAAAVLQKRWLIGGRKRLWKVVQNTEGVQRRFRGSAEAVQVQRRFRGGAEEVVQSAEMVQWRCGGAAEVVLRC